MGDRDADILHLKMDMEKIIELWTYRVDAMYGTKWKHQSKRLRDGYITQLRGMTIYLSSDGEWIIVFMLNFDFLHL